MKSWLHHLPVLPIVVPLVAGAVMLLFAESQRRTREGIAFIATLAQLAIGGVDGTLRGRFRAWSKERAIRAKTGTLASVTSLSGYILPPAGRSPIAFAVLASDVPGKIAPARKAIDAFVEALADELWKGARSP